MKSESLFIRDFLRIVGRAISNGRQEPSNNRNLTDEDNLLFYMYLTKTKENRRKYLDLLLVGSKPWPRDKQINGHR